MADNPRRKELRIILNNRIQDELDKNKWTKSTLVDAINEKLKGEYEFSKKTIYDCCNGESLPAPDCLAAVANVLGVTVDYLLGLTDTSIRLDPEDSNFGNSIFNFIDWFNSTIGKDKKIIMIIGDRIETNQITTESISNKIVTTQIVTRFIIEDSNKLMLFPSSKRHDKICHKSYFVIANGNIYPEAVYDNHEFGVAEHSSYYDLINEIVRENTLLGLKYLRELHSAYRRDRYWYGSLGRLLDIDFFLLNYMAGYFYKMQK